MNEIEKILIETGAILKGHFLLSSGLHSDTYFQLALVFQFPHYGEIICKKIAEKISDKKIDVVIGPAIGGIIIAYELARVLRCRGIFSEREDGIMKLRRGFKIEKGENVFICEDAITTGASVEEVIKLIEEKNANIKGIGCVVQRGEVKFNYPFFSLLKVEVKNYTPENCSMCKSNIPLVKPGSRKL